MGQCKEDECDGGRWEGHASRVVWCSRVLSLSIMLAFLTGDVVVRPRVEVAVRGTPDKIFQELEHTLTVLQRPTHICWSQM